MATEVGSDVADVAEALAARTCMFPTSLDQSTTDGPRPLRERLAADDDSFEQIEAALTVSQLCSGLEVADQDLLRMRFYDGLSQRAIASRLGLSQMKVCRRLHGLLAELRERAVAA